MDMILLLQALRKGAAGAIIAESKKDIVQKIKSLRY